MFGATSAVCIVKANTTRQNESVLAEKSSHKDFSHAGSPG